jgi:ATPase family associated with various cellular activities (AAA)
MSSTPFPDNWSYLKVELNWLERVLLTAVARQKQDWKEVDRVARSPADRATSHWWKGIVSLSGPIAHDSPVKPQPKSATGTPTLADRIQATQGSGIVLALPTLCDRLTLTPFEKSLILMALAPEVNRRYAQLYGYLQNSYLQAQNQSEQLPTVDLVLKLFCRHDGEWRIARSRLTTSPLIHYDLLDLHTQQATSLLSRSLKLADPLVNFLLAEQPNLADLTALLTVNQNDPEALFPADSSMAMPCRDCVSLPPLSPAPIAADQAPPSLLSPPLSLPALPFSNLILPPALLLKLQHLCDRCQFADQVTADWGFQALLPDFALFVGPPGTGKTAAAQAIAHTLGQPLWQIDLATVLPQQQITLIEEIATQNPPILLLKSAHLWLGRSAPLPAAAIAQFLARRASPSLTLLSSPHLPALTPVWRSAQLLTLHFLRPQPAARRQLWQRAFPPQVPLDRHIEWEWLAQKFPLSGGEIQEKARSAAIYAMADSGGPVTMQHIRQALGKKRVKGEG